MANIMNLVRVKNNPSRNGFDLSTKRNFSAKVGELLPVYAREVIPGDKVEIDLQTFVRSMPLNTAAFARLRGYFDFFYVPYSTLWNRANSVLSQMNYNQMHATGLQDFDNVYNGEVPYITQNQISTYLENLRGFQDTASKTNYFGYNRADLTEKLLEYLGYGVYNADSTKLYNLQMNVFGLLAYQKIYADYYRDEQWEKAQPSAFNVDYMSGTTSMNIDIPTGNATSNKFVKNYNFFDLRYCNWPKDLYHGLLPNSQYGSQSVVPLGSDGANNDGNFVLGLKYPNNVVNNVHDQSAREIFPSIDEGSHLDPWQKVPLSGSASLSILALRQYEMLQKYKEIQQASPQNYKDQVEAIWGVKVSKHLSHKCSYLGGVDMSLDINEVINTNITGNNQAEIAGKGAGIGNGKISFESDGQFGLIMCVFHMLPSLDYTTSYIQPDYLRVNAEDFANPVFDRVGMQPVDTTSIWNRYVDAGRPPVSFSTPFKIGYAPRYIDYKTDIDRSFGAFRDTLAHWVIKYDETDVRNALSSTEKGGTPAPEDAEKTTAYQNNYTFFKVNPAVMNNLFTTAADSTLATDQFLISSFFDVKAVRNLDTNGLPY